MPYPLIVEPEAEFELEHAVNWYNDQRPGLGQEFLKSVEEVFDRIREMPELLIVRQRPVLWLINRMRIKAGRKPLVIP